jgi:glycosyltransferase involved in cell wall biosynthesis
MNAPLISVFINTYNHERYIEQAIVSVLEQDFPSADTEILVVDDGSTDRTPEIVRKFEPHLRLLRKANGGQASAFNSGIPEASGEIVAFLDGDDWWAKEKLTAVAEAFEQHPGVAAVGHGFYIVRNDEPPREMFVPAKTCRLDLSSIEAAHFADQGRTLLGTSRLSVRRNVLDRIGPIPEELVFCADTPVLTLALVLGGAIVLDLPLCYYRHHSESLFAHDPKDLGRLRRRLDILAFLLKSLPPRLAELGAAPEVIDALYSSDRVELGRLELQLGQGGRWKSFRTERQSFRASYRRAGLAYRLFQSVVSACALILSPSRLSQLRGWYARNKIYRFRDFLGKPDPKVPPTFFQRRSVPSEGFRSGPVTAKQAYSLEPRISDGIAAESESSLHRGTEPRENRVSRGTNEL